MLERTSCSYGDCLKLFTEHMDFLSPSDKEWIMGRGLAECLDWPRSSKLQGDSPAGPLAAE
jgi:hypothetical protein